MWLIKTKVEEHYQNDRGDTAVIAMFPDDSVVLTIRDGDFHVVFFLKFREEGFTNRFFGSDDTFVLIV